MAKPLAVRYVNLGGGKTAAYLTGYMRWLITKSGMRLDDAAPIILASVSDVDLFPALRNLRRVNPHSTIIVGGFEAYAGEWMLAYADAVVVGKGERFIRLLGESGEIPLDLPEVMTRDGHRVVIPYEDSDLAQYPLIRTGKRKFYAVGGFGCKNKCAFCLTSWAQKERHISQDRIRAIERQVANAGNGCRLTVIANETPYLLENINAQSMRVRDLIRNWDWLAAHKGSYFSLIHLGVEGFTEETRRKLGKPISNDEVRLALHLLRQINQPCELFFITGLPGDDNRFELLDELLEPDTASKPPIKFKFTTLDPLPHTPLWTLPLDQIGEVTQEQAVEWHRTHAMGITLRVRTFPIRTPARALWRAAMRRCMPDEVNALGAPPVAHSTNGEFLDSLRRGGLEHTIDPMASGRYVANSRIVTPYRQVLPRAAARWGLRIPDVPSQMNGDKMSQSDHLTPPRVRQVMDVPPL